MAGGRVAAVAAGVSRRVITTTTTNHHHRHHDHHDHQASQLIRSFNEPVSLTVYLFWGGGREGEPTGATPAAKPAKPARTWTEPWQPRISQVQSLSWSGVEWSGSLWAPGRTTGPGLVFWSLALYFSRFEGRGRGKRRAAAPQSLPCPPSTAPAQIGPRSAAVRGEEGTDQGRAWRLQPWGLAGGFGITGYLWYSTVLDIGIG
ncbi:predicted protein [Histoplasma capsulatum G186AR]|uniref:Uncharacterized protein n=1 Tax=Ajellomyces capsulatus (strain G186AR / H82 / ATCC MYA-2454 / RMSCC 2432) TaxID=447093 RepID=C0NYV8_AJECG|nr:uncharacterized protein HCBG_08338 [Histoplasma capsulatum G186AR]EEH03398.1 predicted protein [Histoplasma capsulatum G186AR]